MGNLFRSFLFGKNVAVIIFALSFLSATVNGKMPRKRAIFLGWFNRLQNPSPAPAVQQANSSNVGSTSTSLAQAVPSTSHPQLSQAGSPGALVSLVPQVTSSAPPSNSTVKEAANVAWEGVKTALVLLKESSGWFPPLKSAIGGFLALIDATELASSNAADLELLRQKINCLTPIIEENSRDRSFPWLLRRLSDFAEGLNEIVRKVDKQANHGKTRRFAEGKKDKGDITTFAGAIPDLISNLQSELTLYTSRGINQLLSNESLKKLKESEAGCYDALISVQRRSCTPNTRQKILEDLMEWAKDPHKSRLYWMNGMAGTGKTTIAYSFCEQLQEKGLLGANFFCSRSVAECSDVRNIIPTAARQLARSSPQFASALVEVLGANPQLPSLGNQFKRLISDPFRRISEPVTDTLIIVIDALDECSNGSSEIHLFLEQIYNYFSTKAIPLKVFVTSRPEGIISSTITPLKPSSPSDWYVIHIHDIEGSLVQADIKVYVEDEFTHIAKIRRLEDGWPPSTEVDVVVGNANKLFIYAATVIRYVGEDYGNPRRRLSELASASRVGQGTSRSSSRSTQLIDELYRAILNRALSEMNAEEKLVAQMVVKLVVCAQTPLTLAGIADLLNASDDLKLEILVSDVRTALELLPSVISTPTDEDGVATTFHASFPDFLFDEHRCGSNNHIPFRQSHQDLARLCLHFMDKILTIDNITGSDRWQTVDAIVKERKIGSSISSALAYACMFWASHIETDEIESLHTELEHFLTHQVLRWLEVLSLLRRLDIGVEVLGKMKECKHATLSSEFDDAYKFLKDVFDIINVWPCEVFHSGLMWAPKQSFIRRIYLKTLPFRIVRGHRSGWGACELTIRGHSGKVRSVAVSPDNFHVVSGSWDETVRIWNMSTGEEEHVLRGHSGGVWSVAVSPDCRHIVSGSKDKTVRIWNASTGEEEHVLLGHSDIVTSVTVSSDNRYIVSGSWDETVRIWNASSGEGGHVLRGHLALVNSVAVSSDNCHIVSGSSDRTVRIWNASTGEEEHVLQGHLDSVNSVAVSSDNRHIVSGSSDSTVRVWNVLTGEEEYVILGHPVNSIALSPDSQYIVSGSPDKTVRIWNMLTGEEEHVLRGHSDEVWSVTFSLDNHHVVSGSSDKTVRISNATIGEEEVHGGHSQKVWSVAVSSDNRHVVSGSWDKTVRIWNASTGEEEHALIGHHGTAYSVAVSSDNRHIVSGSEDRTVRMWNLLTGEEEHVLRGHSRAVNTVAVASDNRHIVSGSSDGTVRIWDVLTGEEVHVLIGHSDSVRSVAVSCDNSHIVSGSSDSTVRIWNMLTGEEEHVLRGHSGSVRSAVFSPDNRHIVSGSWDNTVRIWNVSTSDEGLPLVISLVFSSDNCQVMSGPQGNAVPIGKIFFPSMVTALLPQGDNTASRPVMRRLVSGESLHLGVLLGAMRSGPSPVPITLSPDASSVLLSDGEKCLTIPSSLRDITCAAFSGSKVYFGYGTGQITILDISV